MEYPSLRTLLTLVLQPETAYKPYAIQGFAYPLCPCDHGLTKFEHLGCSVIDSVEQSMLSLSVESTRPFERCTRVNAHRSVSPATSKPLKKSEAKEMGTSQQRIV